MYSAFDGFLSRPTWNTTGDLDDTEFYKCLAKVVCDQGFDPRTMGNEFRKAKGGQYDDRINDLVIIACSVAGFLNATGGCRCYEGD